MLKIGLVGLTNVGKSSLCTFLTKKNILIANRFFATIDPNVAIMNLIDPRLEKLSKHWKSQKTIPSAIEIVDIAGLIKGAHQGLGLGNKFLSHIREVDLICQVIRCFEDDNIEHVENSIDPRRDYETVQSELILADYQQIEKKIEKIKLNIRKKQQISKNEKELELLEYLEKNLLEGISIFQLSLTVEQKKIVKSYCLLTDKPTIIIANYNQDKELQDLENYANEKKILFHPLFLRENQQDEKLFQKNVGSQSKIALLTEKIKKLLGLKVFFTVGPKEAKSWLAKQEMSAKQCAGLIHSDIEKKFIRAKVYSYYDWLVNPDENQLKRLGKIRTESAQYIIQDGDICHFII